RLAESQERSSGDADEVPPAIVAGDRLTAAGDVEGALSSYLQQLSLCKKALTDDPNDEAARYNFRRAAARIGLLAHGLLKSGQFSDALGVVEIAITEGKGVFWVPVPSPFYDTGTSNTHWLDVIRPPQAGRS